MISIFRQPKRSSLDWAYQAGKRACVLVTAALLLGCAARAGQSSLQNYDAPPQSIGEARMLEDGTIWLYLRAQTGDAIGDAAFEYKPDSAGYEAVKKHIDPIASGQTKAVPPWPGTGPEKLP
ncbi:hypothetical protein [Pseudomarimonas arenosa]|nr:hypothetical protein [Pseudomarimonas arenosa]